MENIVYPFSVKKKIIRFYQDSTSFSVKSDIIEIICFFLSAYQISYRNELS